jgi:hypothetical protein
MRTLRSRLQLAAVVAASALSAPDLFALPGTHAPAVSTWDARASSVVPGFTLGSLTTGRHLDYASVNANFSSVSGKISAQFGLHYANLGGGDAPTLHGGSATAIAVYSLPLDARFDNGVPTVAFGFYFGIAPTVLISGPLDYMSVPLTLGLGVPISPVEWLTLTPWVEVAPTFDLDASISPYRAQLPSAASLVDPETGQVSLTQEQVSQIVDSALRLNTAFHLSERGGIQLAAHFDDDFSLVVGFMVSRFGTGDSAATALSGSGGILWRWDEIVPSVLPAETRLLRESCEAIVERFQRCPQYKELSAPTPPVPVDEELPECVPPPVESPVSPPKPTPPASPAAPPAPPAAPAPSADPAPPAPSESPPTPEPSPPPPESPAVPPGAPPASPAPY